MKWCRLWSTQAFQSAFILTALTAQSNNTAFGVAPFEYAAFRKNWIQNALKMNRNSINKEKMARNLFRTNPKQKMFHILYILLFSQRKERHPLWNRQIRWFQLWHMFHSIFLIYTRLEKNFFFSFLIEYNKKIPKIVLPVPHDGELLNWRRPWSRSIK